jgi:hypothetical protein
MKNVAINAYFSRLCPLRPMPIQKNWHLIDQAEFLLFVQRSPVAGCAELISAYTLK